MVMCTKVCNDYLQCPHRCQFGEGPERKGWFPMVIVLSVIEDAMDGGAEEEEAQYEVSVGADTERQEA